MDIKKIFICSLDIIILGLLGFASYRTTEAQDYLGAFLVFAPVGLVIIRNAVSKN